MQIELILIFFYKIACRMEREKRHKRNGKETQKEILSLGWCWFNYLQEVLVEISKSKTLKEKLQKCQSAANVRDCIQECKW